MEEGQVENFTVLPGPWLGQSWWASIGNPPKPGRAVAGEWACRRGRCHCTCEACGTHGVHTRRATGSKPQGQESAEVGGGRCTEKVRVLLWAQGLEHAMYMSGGPEQGGHWAPAEAAKLLRDCTAGTEHHPTSPHTQTPD